MTSQQRQSHAAHTRVWWRTCAAAVCVGAATLAHAGVAAAQPAPEVPLATGATHSHSLTLAAGEYARVVIEQQGLNVAVTLSGPDGQVITEVDRASGTRGQEPVVVIAATAGPYQLKVTALAAETDAGRYVLRVVEQRPATPADQTQVAAARACDAGQRLRRQRGAVALAAAIEQYQTALKLSRQLDDQAGTAAALLGLGSTYFRADRLREALACYEQALVGFRAVASRDDEAMALLLRGMTRLALGEPGAARPDYTQALALFRASADRKNIAFALNETGRTYYAEGDGLQALLYYQQALALRREVGDRTGTAFSLDVIGRVYFYVLGDTAAALDYFQQALVIQQEIKEREGAAQTHNDIGRVHFARGLLAQAAAEHQRALSLQTATASALGAAETRSYIGLVHAAAGRHEQALAEFQAALAVQEQSADIVGRGQTLQYMGESYYAVGDYTQAHARLTAALQLRQRVLHRTAEADTRYWLARVESRRGQLAAARQQLEAALPVVEALRSRVANLQLRTAYFASVQQYYELYIDVLMRLSAAPGQRELAGLALSVSERARARALLDTLVEARAEIRKDADPALLQIEAALQRRLSAQAQQQLLDSAAAPEAAAARTQQLAALLREYYELEARIRERSPRYAGLTRPAPLTLGEIQTHLLAPDQMLLEYALGTERSYLWAVTPTTFATYVLPGRAELTVAAARYQQLLTARNQFGSGESEPQRRLRVRAADAGYAAAAADLSRLLLAQVAWPAEVARLVVVGDGGLQYVPFAALPVPGDPAASPLLVRYEVETPPSLNLVAELRRDEATPRPSPTKLVAVLADPVFEPDDERLAAVRPAPAAPSGNTQLAAGTATAARGFLQASGAADQRGHITRLSFTEREAADILAAVRPENGFEALGFDASRAFLTSPDLARFRIIHIATHGLLNRTQPELSGLLLSLYDQTGRPQDGFLQMHELYNLSLPVDMVVLSACDSGVGPELRGEGLAALSRGFMYAGARRVVASLWAVNDAATADLMKRFYQQLARTPDARPAAALRAAQLALWQRRETQAPYFWAAFVVQADAR